MKIRSNFVSNSSSSSFIVCKDLNDKGIRCLKLSRAQKEKINASTLYDETVNIYPEKDYWITEFIYDRDDKKWDIIENNGEYLIYSEGQMCGEPYAEEYFNEYPIDGDVSVFIRKEHDEAKQMSFNKFAKKFKENFGSSEVLVEYTNDNKIILTVIPE